MHCNLDDHALIDTKSGSGRKHDSSEVYFSKISDACDKSIDSHEKIYPTSQALCKEKGCL